ncbi:hypothetical protein DEU56DRAFT_762432 [Suillus clintonianus]|uniref:uncharacterized protein n=1 Tax=Suillus clintonianus TaxID=1904413 RepID=UPI001B86A54F|nr:uncharacterized protein DEU56DRAFT_920491 [Suillus clintonianus]XP_041200713.1 uncharacterized protein DEU56DRAFT_762432 [Suillus clintonianus]KAG2108353.1 hypothetical protein DEU56DRAFT_920491 [Suillus clintonianus]KAG2109523.1 hypothetical protein DEU56DRAFT_762432 [Suillus clintonianus]
MPPFVFINKPPVDDESARLRKEFASLVAKLDVTMKVVPDDQPELMEEKRDWNRQWDELSASFSTCFAAAQKRGLQFSLSAADTALVKSGNLTYAMHECQLTEKMQDDQEKMDVVLGNASAGEEDADGEPEVASTKVATSTKRPRKAAGKGAGKTKKSPEVVPSEADEPQEPKLGGRAIAPGPKVDHVLPCANCRKRDKLCSGSRGQQCDPCKVARTKCEYSSFGKASAKKGPSVASTPPVASGSHLSAPGPIRRTVSSPERQVWDPIEVSDGEMGSTARRRSVATGKGKKIAVEDDVEDAEDLEELHEMRQVRAKLMQAYSMIFEATLALDKREARILKKRAARK